MWRFPRPEIWMWQEDFVDFDAYGDQPWVSSSYVQWLNLNQEARYVSNRSIRE